MTKRICEAEKSASRRKNILYAYKIFFLRVQKNRPLYTMTIGNRRNESRLPQKVALCHNEVVTKVSSCQKTRTEGKAKDSRTKPEVFPMYHNVSFSCFAFFRSVRLQFCTKVHIRTQRNCLTGKRKINRSIQEFNCTFGACTDNNYQ